MTDEIPLLSWTDFVHDLSDLLKDQAVSTPLHLVGGAVRDALLRGKITDVDIVVDGEAATLARQVADWLDGDIYVMDRERDVARVWVDWRDERVSIDFARMRGATLEEDLRDRDFTINAMASDLLGDIEVLIDPLGGAADLRQKVLRRCSDESIKNDPIRALRAVRLSAQFQLKIHPDTGTDLRKHAVALRDCSGERIRDEFFKLLRLDQAARGLRVLLHVGLLENVLPRSAARVDGDANQGSASADWTLSLATVERIAGMLKAISSRRTDNTAAAFDLGTLVIQLDRFRAQLQAHIGRTYGGARRHAELLMLAALLLDRAKVDTAMLKLSAEEDRNLYRSVANAQMFTAQPRWSILDQHRYWHALKESGIDVILLALAQYLAKQRNELNQQEWLGLVETATDLLHTYFQRYDEIVDPPLLLNGHDIQEQWQVKRGPLIGDLLNALREAQVAGEVCSEDDANHFISRRLKQPKS